ncbi:endonuclease [Leptolyngbya sp. NIES-3755]|nr:endonuclease [Leptolyngbya sp. NIES-3755]
MGCDRKCNSVKPDIAAIQESSAEAKTELSQRLKNFPFSYRTSGGGLTIFSRFPLISPERKGFKNGSALITSLNINQKTVQLIAVHPSVPVKPSTFKRRNAFLAELRTYLQQQPRILLGDFNLTPWSPYYSELLNNTGLHNTRLGFGIEPSWIESATYVHHPNWVTALVKIPIDHIFVTRDFKVSNCQTMKAANSDHRMLWSDLSL